MIRLIFWVFVLVVALSYFGVTVQDIVNSPDVEANFAYLATFLSSLWNTLVSLIDQIKSIGR